ncbi:DnaQ-like DNA polymerase III subunit [Gordonia phage VanLee]|uniref:DnaQ-like DNA polymerase III subunit n=1 Tax=Gordonia phage VanLee TaxID=2845816 RepID=A0A8F2D9I1_9CAUD|nr:DnaQ-like DNA polymerase III subunit [Gordonia phage VanLee]QWS68229.1 DnaQ-like DNA polymerase III subunit [Gordonia phage VanLee]
MTQAALDPFRSWTEMPLACFDLETTGPIPTEARVVTAYIGTIDGATVEANEWLLDPEIEIPEGAAAVHGITTERARAEGTNYTDGVIGIWGTLQLLWGDGRIVAIYNASYDITLMCTELTRLGIDPGEIGPIVDPLVIDKRYDRYRKGSRKLDAACKHYGVKLGDAHQADADALAAARLAWKLPRVFPTLGEFTADQLQAEQMVWHREQKLGLIEYFKRTGKEIDDVSTEWPVRAA